MEDTRRYPLFLGLGLRSRDQHLLDYWLGSTVRKHERQAVQQPSLFSSGLNYFPNADFRTIEHLAQWYLPLFVVARLSPELERSRLFSFLKDLGVAALWLLPEYGQPVIFPRLHVPIHKRKVFLIEENIKYRDLFRQIFYFAGYTVQVDFSGVDDVLVALDQGDSIPELMFLSLDCQNINHTELIYGLDSFLKKHPKRHSQLRILFTKDFRLPGLSLAVIENLLHAHARRIFSPGEAIFALLESFFVRDTFFLRGERKGEEKLVLDTVLYGSNHDFTQLKVAQATRPQCIPFLWIYEFMARSIERSVMIGQKS